jgi:hypothetical protein
MYSPELNTRIAQWRAKAQDGTITLAEMKEAIIAVRQGRINAAQTAKIKGAKAPQRPVDDLLGELGIT